ncbi:MAG TPA: hypothetical protein VK956_15750, partial [Verrucomicrobium sp.]|nr:hypothetical protein [Verrucomicrobium sp.]
MKALFNLLIICCALFLAYDYFVVPVEQRRVFSRTATKEDNLIYLKREDEMSPPVTPLSKSALPGGSMTDSPKVSKGQTTVDAFTQNWTKFPASAFPRPVQLNKEVKFALGAGSSVVKAGSEVVAMSCSAEGLVLAPSAGSKARSVVPLETTDFKSRMTAIYDAWQAKQAQAQAPSQVVQSTPPPAAPVISSADQPPGPGPGMDLTANSVGTEPAGRPAISADGTIPVLMAAMKSGRVSDVKPENITRWGAPKLEMIDGQPVWTVDVEYKSKTQFGDFDAET